MRFLTVTIKETKPSKETVHIAVADDATPDQILEHATDAAGEFYAKPKIVNQADSDIWIDVNGVRWCSDGSSMLRESGLMIWHSSSSLQRMIETKELIGKDTDASATFHRLATSSPDIELGAPIFCVAGYEYGTALFTRPDGHRVAIPWSIYQSFGCCQFGQNSTDRPGIEPMAKAPAAPWVTPVYATLNGVVVAVANPCTAKITAEAIINLDALEAGWSKLKTNVQS